jgi:hypothetical protein
MKDKKQPAKIPNITHQQKEMVQTSLHEKIKRPITLSAIKK